MNSVSSFFVAILDALLVLLSIAMFATAGDDNDGTFAIAGAILVFTLVYKNKERWQAQGR